MLSKLRKPAGKLLPIRATPPYPKLVWAMDSNRQIEFVFVPIQHSWRGGEASIREPWEPWADGIAR